MQGNLAAAYRERIRGERADNLERAIRANEAALTVYTPEAFPQEWARVQNNLGLAYQDRIRGVRRRAPRGGDQALRGSPYRLHT